MAVATPMAIAHAWTWVNLGSRIGKLEKHWEDCEQKWAREVRRGATLAALPISPEAPSLPPPDWDEETGVRQLRAELEAQGLKEGLAELLRRYVEERTPVKIRRRLPSKPGT